MSYRKDVKPNVRHTHDAISKIKSTVGTIGTYACGGQGNKVKSFDNVDCSMKQEVQFARMDKSNSNGFEAHTL